MIVALWPLVILIVGLLVWLLVKNNAIVTEIGRWLFIIGLFWFVYSLAGKTLVLGD